MTTIAISRPRFSLSSIPMVRLGRVNTSALLSIICISLFFLYLIVPHSIAGHLSHFSVVYVVFAPLAAFIFSIVSVRQITRTHDKGLLLSSIALIISSLYIIMSLALPLVLVGCYILYAYILR